MHYHEYLIEAITTVFAKGLPKVNWVHEYFEYVTHSTMAINKLVVLVTVYYKIWIFPHERNIHGKCQPVQTLWNPTNDIGLQLV